MELCDERWSGPQLRAIEGRGHNLLVSAGAGSGKTSVLVERVVRRVAGENPVDIDRLLIVTFTEAAAAEMRNRIATRLEQLLEEARRGREAAAVRRLSRQLLLLDQAQVSTLHSFCMEVVRRNFLTLGMEPSFRMLDEDEAAILRREQFEQLLEQRLQGDEQGRFAEMLVRFRAADPLRLMELVFRLDEFARSQPDPTGWLDGVSRMYAQAREQSFSQLPWTPVFLQWMDGELAYAASLCAHALALAAQAEELARYADNLAAVRDALNQWRQALAEQGLDASVPHAAALSGLLAATVRGKDHPLKEEVRRLRDRAKKSLLKVIAIAGRGEAALRQDIVDLAPSVEQLMQFVKDLQVRCDEAKRRRQALDFNDLEHLALRVLSDPESGERDRLRRRFVEVFVDEYQDTSPIQDALLAAVSRPEGNLFAVGDVKQSIYRFRMAEPRLFLHRYRTMGRSEPGEVVELTANYRSRGEVVDAVNYLFMQLFVPDLGGIDYSEDTWMKAGAEYPPPHGQPDLAGPIEVHLIERADADRSRQDESEEEAETGRDAAQDAAADGPEADAPSPEDLTALEREGAVIARRILELMGLVDGHARRAVWDASARQYRPLRYRDIVILLRSARGRTNVLLDVLARHGIPAHGATSTGFYGALEVRWLTSALLAVDNPRREVALAALLRSPLGGFSDRDLAQIRLFARGNYYEALREAVASARRPGEGQTTRPLAPDLAARLNAFWSVFQSWRQLARQDSAEAVLRRILADTRLMPFLLAMPGGETRRANVEQLLDQARAFDHTSSDGLFGFVRRLGDLQRHQLDAGGAQAIAAGEDVVRVMTIHQSKGLEFPVVFVADLGKLFYQDPQEKSYPLHPDLGLGPQFVDAGGRRRWLTMASVALAEVNRREFLAEEARVLYVALTRARERLILVASATDLPRRVQWARQGVPPSGRALPGYWLLRAAGYLDWLLPALLRHRDGAALRRLTAEADEWDLRPLAGVYDHPARFQVRLWNAAPNGLERVSADAWQAGETALPWPDFAAFSDWICAPTEPSAQAEVAAALAGVNAGQAFTEVPGKVSATDLRRLWVAQTRGRGKAHGLSQSAAESLLETPRFTGAPASGRASGSAYHAVMQHLDLRIPATRDAVAAAVDELWASGRITERERAAVSVEDIVAFLQSELGQRARRALRLWREQPFFARLELADAPIWGTPGQAPFVVVQGVIDLMFEDSDGLVLVDYKTDRVNRQEVERQAAEYSAQVAAYLRVVQSAAGGRPVSAWLYFVRARADVPMADVDLSAVFKAQAGEAGSAWSAFDKSADVRIE
ncbi:helicase-exonuclease AddAB subunit AddA [Alicyclobacillus kakegawensis]|uniref:helicase-exonuclease AddAB subunit AddA n=1 Tax=Alicyclobacillus kakegawensis TaxID=392012 RepID=UPI00082ABBFA|nr:helicase-exonuclease AddAB subunit AddA [Alicyclobacillus kakegawensis]